MNPKNLAEKAAAAIFARHDVDGHTVVLADYASEHDLHQVAGEFELTIEDHREALAHLARLLGEARAAFANIVWGQKKARL